VRSGYATSIIGSQQVAHEAPDGYMLLVTSNAHTIALRKKSPFDTI
jgi:hypothetical protein